MNHQEVKDRLLRDPQTRGAYERPPLRLAIARAVVERRRELGISQEELAQKLGTSQAQVWRLESGQGNPTMSTLERLGEVLGLSPEIRFSEVSTEEASRFAFGAR
jgi:transcriptional regulator with XRE-family HTH domain